MILHITFLHTTLSFYDVSYLVGIRNTLILHTTFLYTSFVKFRTVWTGYNSVGSVKKKMKITWTVLVKKCPITKWHWFSMVGRDELSRNEFSFHWPFWSLLAARKSQIFFRCHFGEQSVKIRNLCKSRINLQITDKTIIILYQKSECQNKIIISH